MVDESSFDTIAVSTADTNDAILAANNSAAWTLNYEKWRSRLKYLVCLRKEGTARQAFLVCKISTIRLRADPNDTRPRYAIEFDEYADAPVGAKLIPGSQYPVRFGMLSDFGFDPGELRFRAVPPKTIDYSYSPRIDDSRRGMGIGIPEAKRRLAIGLGVREDQIDIVVRG